MWNKWGLLFAGLAFSATTFARESKPVEDRDAFEKQYIECVMNNFKGDCVVPLIRDYIDPSAINAEEISDTFNILAKDFAKGGGVYKVHPFNKKIKAEIFDDRMYLITKKNGELLYTRIIFRKIVDQWHVMNFIFTGDRNDIAKLVDVPF